MVAWQHKVLSTAALNWTLHGGVMPNPNYFTQQTLPGFSPRAIARRLTHLRDINMWYRLFCTHVEHVEYLPPAWQVVELRRTVVFEGPGVRKQVAALIREGGNHDMHPSVIIWRDWRPA
jgi:hypothetical protein